MVGYGVWKTDLIRIPVYGMSSIVFYYVFIKWIPACAGIHRGEDLCY